MKKPKLKFTKKEFEDNYKFFKWFLMNFALKQIHRSDLGYQTMQRIARLLQELDNEIMFLTGQDWIKQKLKEFEVKAKSSEF